jgi:hypothetical protein
VLRKSATWFLGLQEDLAARENGLRDAAGVPFSNLLSCDFDSPFHPRQLLKQLDLHEFQLFNQSTALSDLPSVSALVHMICNHPSCKEVIQLLLSDEQCLSHVRDRLLYRHHLKMPTLIGPSVVSNCTLSTSMPFVSILAAHVLASQDWEREQELNLKD